jgi:hypothetical protein
MSKNKKDKFQYKNPNKFRETLESFNYRANKLTNNSFIKKVRKEGKISGVKIKGFNVEIKEYNEDVIDGFVCNLRFFIQDNEPTSFRNILKFYEKSDINKYLRKEFIDLRTNLNKFLDDSPRAYYNLSVNNKILRGFIYGDKVHKLGDRSKKERDFFDKWLTGSNVFPYNVMNPQLLSEFYIILVEFLNYILKAVEINIRVLKELNENELKSEKKDLDLICNDCSKKLSEEETRFC